MKFLETPEEKKSFAITSAIFVILFLLFFFFMGLKYMDPPPENGIAVNFGTTDTGSGDVQPTEPVQSALDQAKTEPTPSDEDNVLTQDDDAPVTMPKTEKPKPQTKPIEPKPVKPTETKPTKPTNNALNSIIKGPKQDGKIQAGHGPDNEGGDKGNPNGSLYANSFYGNGSGDGIGTGKGTGWGLTGRKLSGNSKKIQDCNESGKVVVKIWVNRQGNVIKAERTQGTTNTNPCLVNPALETAKTFKWQPDADAPETQIGFVVVNFQVGE
ncbi:energy transducer TonB [Flavobacterium cyclinae]|uniref:energy transducer TonB n=1 Tax=Flavobacterium cyclinae TaxID=2895947 RepID=UPI001E304EA1|nr:energy transducer TonB [Flavobacterium cyclinae]UGS20714.1 energy transducer TonB [Flavobacterium cyclinae]